MKAKIEKDQHLGDTNSSDSDTNFLLIKLSTKSNKYKYSG